MQDHAHALEACRDSPAFSGTVVTMSPPSRYCNRTALGMRQAHIVPGPRKMGRPSPATAARVLLQRCDFVRLPCHTSRLPARIAASLQHQSEQERTSQGAPTHAPAQQCPAGHNVTCFLRHIPGWSSPPFAGDASTFLLRSTRKKKEKKDKDGGTRWLCEAGASRGGTGGQAWTCRFS